jgi:hypothetical protein
MGRQVVMLTTLATAVLLSAACGGGREVRVRRAVAPTVADSIYVQLVNDHFSDARVYALYEGGARYSLGLIVGKGRMQDAAILWQPRPLVFEISFIAEEGLYLTEELTLEPGDLIQLNIPPNISSSAFFRRVSD